ncbi:MAG: hypothetical protein RSE25_02795 [Bacteroidales bacterium]
MKNLLKYITASFNRIILIIAIIALFVQCTKENESEMGSFPYIKLSTNDTSVSNESQQFAIALQTNRNVKVSITFPQEKLDAAEWITATVSANKINITILKNELEKDRSCNINIITENSTAEANVKIEQDASSERTYPNNMFLSTQNAIDNISDYTRIAGAMFIGDIKKQENAPKSINASNKENITTIIDGVTYIAAPSQINNIRGIQIINKIKKNALYILNTEIDSINKFVVKYDLKTLYAEYGALKHTAAIPEMTTLTKLSIRGNNILDISKLSALNGLTKLNISNNNITDIAALKAITSLDTLILGDISYSKESNGIYNLDPLKTLAKLKYVSLSGLPISTIQLEDLKTYLPANCKIIAEKLSTPILPAAIVKNISMASDNQLLIRGKLMHRNPKDDITKIGFYYGSTETQSEMKSVDVKISEINASDSTFTKIIEVKKTTDLIFVKAFATNSKGTTYSTFKTFGEKIYKGDIFVKSKDELNALITARYTKINGALVIGKSSKEKQETSIPVSIGDVTYYFEPSDIDNIDNIEDLNEVTSGVYIVNTQISKISNFIDVLSTPKLIAKANKLSVLPDISRIKGLKVLSVSMNNISNIEQLSKVSGLEELYLGDKNMAEKESNKISDLSSILSLKALKILDISGLPISPITIENAKKVLTSCTIYSEKTKKEYVPIVLTNNASNILSSTAQLNGEVLDLGGTISASGFEYGISKDNLQYKASAELTAAKLNVAISKLSESTKYYFRAFAKNQFGTGYGDIKEFSTISKEDEKTFKGNVVINSGSDITEFLSSGYEKINGALIIGEVVKNTSGTTISMNIEGTDYVFERNDTYISLDLICEKIKNVTKGVYVINRYLPNIMALREFSTPKLVINNSCEGESLMSSGNFETFLKIKGLKILNISGNNITNITKLAKSLELTELYIGNKNNPVGEVNKISDIYPLTSLKKLMILDISGLPICANMLAQVKSIMTWCTIYSEGLKNTDLPIAYTHNATSITSNAAILKGTCTYTNEWPGEYGIYIGKSIESIREKKVIGKQVSYNNTEYFFTVDPSDFTSNTTYYYQSYFKFNKIYIFGEIKQFTTSQN